MTDKMEQYKTRTFKLNPEVAFDDDAFHHLLKSKFGANYLQHVRVVKRSIDARSKQIKVHVQVAIFDDSAPEEISYKIPSHSVASSPPVVIVGAGPAGLFAALKAIDLGVKPIILERGKDARRSRAPRRRARRSRTRRGTRARPRRRATRPEPGYAGPARAR